MSHHHLTIEERACIAVYYKEKRSITEIARLLNRNKSTISREIKRNPSRDEGYNAIGAQRKYNSRRKKSVRPKRLLTENGLYNLIYQGLEKYWSPEQIVNTLPKGFDISICTIYRAIQSGLFPKEICQKLRRYGKKLKHKKRKGVCYDFSEVRTIDKRSPAVNRRSTYGHWELDTVVLRPECGCHLATFVERKSRFLIVRKIANKKARTMSDAIIEALGTFPSKMVKTLTVDRGLEFTDWKRVEEALKVKVYFCNAYSPWQRGTNENTNGLLRQFFPRRKLLPTISDDLVEAAQNLINDRPRKCINWASPYQSFFRCI